MKSDQAAALPRLTARKKLADALTQEILDGKYASDPLLPSEHQLCRRFDVSRVTVRLALSDLQSRGLIYRQHGKGTFAYPLSKIGAKPIVVVAPAADISLRDADICSMCQGIAMACAEADSYFISTQASPGAWSPEIVSNAGGVVVFGSSISPSDLELIERRSIPFYLVGTGSVRFPYIEFPVEDAIAQIGGQLKASGHRKCTLLFRTQRPIVQRAMQGLRDLFGEDHVTKACVPDGVAPTRQMLSSILGQNDQPTALISFDSDLALAALSEARRRKISVPAELSIIALFGDSNLSLLESPITSVVWPLQSIGHRMVQNLNRAGVRAATPPNIIVEFTIETGATMNGAPVRV